MAEIKGLTGLRPLGDDLKKVTCPPYDVIKPGSSLAQFLRENQDSLSHITLGEDPVAAWADLQRRGVLQKEEEPCFYLYEQTYGANVRRGVLAAVAVTDYRQGQIIRHEKTFDEKVKGRLALREKTGYTFEPVFLLTQAPLRKVLDTVVQKCPVDAEFVSDLGAASDLHGIRNRIFKIAETTPEGEAIRRVIATQPLYIADGHHRYHASLCHRQTHCLAYLCEAVDARILAYNRVINGLFKFAQIKDKLSLVPVDDFQTPPKHHFSLYSPQGTFLLAAQNVPDDVVGRLDCRILEKELYPLLGLTPQMITNLAHFDYYAENELSLMKKEVDAGNYDLAVALAPVAVDELIAVAKAGIARPDIVMPEKSTFFSPKILSGIFIYAHTKNA